MTAPASTSPLFSSASLSAHTALPSAVANANAPSANARPRIQYLSIAGELLMLDIRPVERMIMGFVLSLEKANHRCFASNGYFAKLCNVSPSTTQRAVRNLVNRGLLRHYLLHRSGTQRLLSINTAQLDAEVHTALAVASAQSLAGCPPKTMLAPDLRPTTPTENESIPVPAPMTLEEEYFYRQMEKDLLYSREMGANVAAVVHHLEGQQVQALERVQALIHEQVRLAEEQRHSAPQASFAEARSTEVSSTQAIFAQATVPPEMPNSTIEETVNTETSPTVPVSGDSCPAIQPIAIRVQDEPDNTPRQIDEPPQQCDEAPRQFDDPIYTQFYKKKSSYKKQQGEKNSHNICSDIVSHSNDAVSEISAEVIVSDILPKEIGNEENASFVPTEAVAQTNGSASTSGNAHLNALQTTLATLKARANDRVKTLAHHTSPSPTQTTSAGTQQPYPQHYSKHQHKSQGTPYGKPSYGKPKKPQTFYQKQGQQNDEARRGVMTFQELPHGAMFMWEGSGSVYGTLRKLDDEHALRLENNKTLHITNLQGRVEVQRW